MLKRIYIDNFKCFVNFELTIQNLNLFFGQNGCGKTTVFEVLEKIQRFIIETDSVKTLFKPLYLTRWQTTLLQRFEIEIAGNGGIYRYALGIQHALSYPQIEYERLVFNEQPLFEYQRHLGIAQLYDDEHRLNQKYLFDTQRSGVGVIQPRTDNQKLIGFKQRLARFFIVHIEPNLMDSETYQEVAHPNWSMSNYAAWFRYLSQEYQGQVFHLTQELRKILWGFDAFKIAQRGEKKILTVDFIDTALSDKPINYYFSELSSGQRMLIALYTLLYCLPDKPCTLCIEKPEEFLALPDIQPWLDSLHEYCLNKNLQTLMISHHPKLINSLIQSSYWFNRSHQSPVVAQAVTQEGGQGQLSISELAARGWIYDYDDMQLTLYQKPN